MLIASVFYQKLPPDLAQLLRETVKPAMRDLTEVLRKQSEEAMQVLRQSGLEIIPPPKGPILRQFYAIHEQVGRNLAGKVYPPQLLDRVYAILERPAP
jgi:TRAP-type C4-dicarboxylate transport system substrate-binding protein